MFFSHNPAIDPGTAARKSLRSLPVIRRGTVSEYDRRGFGRQHGSGRPAIQSGISPGDWGSYHGDSHVQLLAAVRLELRAYVPNSDPGRTYIDYAL